jgi:hypothetical protein
MPLRIDVYHHIQFDVGQLAGIESSLLDISRKVTKLMATSTELLDASAALKAKVDAFGPAVDAAEARLTAAIAQLGTIPPAVQADIDAAFETLRGAGDSADTIKADLEDGVDEAATPPSP